MHWILRFSLLALALAPTLSPAPARAAEPTPAPLSKVVQTLITAAQCEWLHRRLVAANL